MATNAKKPRKKHEDFDLELKGRMCAAHEQMYGKEGKHFVEFLASEESLKLLDGKDPPSSYLFGKWVMAYRNGNPFDQHNAKDTNNCGHWFPIQKKIRDWIRCGDNINKKTGRLNLDRAGILKLCKEWAPTLDGCQNFNGSKDWVSTQLKKNGYNGYGRPLISEGEKTVVKCPRGQGVESQSRNESDDDIDNESNINYDNESDNSRNCRSSRSHGCRGRIDTKTNGKPRRDNEVGAEAEPDDTFIPHDDNDYNDYNDDDDGERGVEVTMRCKQGSKEVLQRNRRRLPHINETSSVHQQQRLQAHINDNVFRPNNEYDPNAISPPTCTTMVRQGGRGGGGHDSDEVWLPSLRGVLLQRNIKKGMIHIIRKIPNTRIGMTRVLCRSARRRMIIKYITNKRLDIMGMIQHQTISSPRRNRTLDQMRSAWVAESPSRNQGESH